MKFTLHYRGTLKANGTPTHKAELRLHFHRQLSTLWNQYPLCEYKEWLQEREPRRYSVLRTVGGYTFAPLITAEMNALAELRIVLLRPEKPGGLITKGGDIDNRLKTLFDALTMPRHPESLVKGQGDFPSPTFCLLEDDNLVSGLSVDTQQLLEPGVPETLVDLSIHVTTRVTAMTSGNWQFVS